jgi:hypothetical protein
MSATKDYWVAVVGDPRWHFGPFGSEEDAQFFADEHDGDIGPLWDPNEMDAISGQQAIRVAAAAVVSRTPGGTDE